MHPSLSVDEIIRLIANEIVASESKSTAVTLACCCKSFEEPVLDALWDTQDRLTPLLKCFPQHIWEGAGGYFDFNRIPTKAEWAHFRKYARRMRELIVDTSEDPVTSEVLLALQLRAVDNPLFPRLKAFECKEATEAFIPFIPLLLSPTTTSIEIRFAEDTPTLVVASMVSRFSTLCPNLEYINLPCLPRDSVITNAVSEMLLACNRDILRAFEVDSPLTEEAREVVYRLPRLSDLWTVIRGSTSLPTVVLPNLDLIDIDYDNHLDWLEGFRGATLGRLKEAYFRSGSEQIGDFLGTFERVALATSTQNTLSTLKLYVPRSWNPNYSSLLSFKRLKELEIQFSCGGGCSSKVDDEVVISLAQVMPELEVLQLGKAPCRTPTGITINGLIGLACNCPRLSNLRIHFQATSLVNAVASAALPSPSEYEPAARQEDCVLVDLEVGEIPIPVGSASTLALILLQIFPRILNVVYTNQEWKVVAETVKDFRRIRALVRHSRDAICMGRPPGNGQV